jgi:hypothetical protein
VEDLPWVIDGGSRMTAKHQQRGDGREETRSLHGRPFVCLKEPSRIAAAHVNAR